MQKRSLLLLINRKNTLIFIKKSYFLSSCRGVLADGAKFGAEESPPTIKKATVGKQEERSSATAKETRPPSF